MKVRKMIDKASRAVKYHEEPLPRQLSPQMMGALHKRDVPPDGRQNDDHAVRINVGLRDNLPQSRLQLWNPLSVLHIEMWFPHLAPVLLVHPPVPFKDRPVLIGAQELERSLTSMVNECIPGTKEFVSLLPD